MPRSSFLTTYCLAAAIIVQLPNRGIPPDAGEFVQVGSHRMYLQCLGTVGRMPTVIFESGGGGSSAEWVPVQKALGATIRSCAYDRAGLGKSEPGPGPRTLAQETFELHVLLSAAKVGGPYVLVGQSIGGVSVRLYAQQFAADVAGVVLVDPTHESAVLGSLRYGGMVRLREKATGRGIPGPRLLGPVDPPDPAAPDYLAEELALLYRARLQTPQSLGDKPLVVLAAGMRSPPPPGIAADDWSALRDERDAMLRDLTGLSGNSAYQQDPASGHAMHTQNPQLVARAIRAVVESATSGTRLRF